jgi:hypothetical protein
MAVAFRPEHVAALLAHVPPPLVLQQFVDHDAVMYKVCSCGCTVDGVFWC